ncbi:hypothetical protein CRG98_015707 [Punica granatum]|uniref:Uncharacterized protein n=1 Tax=Punica granatum TaxID=22663 RepID=A0A2I0K884_PUNGR|nr:hypothetical protein CRG98_015707 [Punica granatum]
MNPLKSPAESPSCEHPNFISSGHAYARLWNAAWEYPPSRGRATDAREKELPLTVYDPQCGLKEPGVGSDQTNRLQENRLIPTVTVGPIELPGDI